MDLPLYPLDKLSGQESPLGHKILTLLLTNIVQINSIKRLHRCFDCVGDKGNSIVWSRDLTQWNNWGGCLEDEWEEGGDHGKGRQT